MGARGSRIYPSSIPLEVNIIGQSQTQTETYNISSTSETNIHLNYDAIVRMKICKRGREPCIKLAYNGYIQIDKPNTFKEGLTLNISMNRTIRRTNWDIEYLRWPEGLTSIKLKYTHRPL
jgi:hypothetical protein